MRIALLSSKKLVGSAHGGRQIWRQLDCVLLTSEHDGGALIGDTRVLTFVHLLRLLSNILVDPRAYFWNQRSSAGLHIYKGKVISLAVELIDEIVLFFGNVE